MSETTLRPATDLDFADVVLGAVGLVLVAFHHGRAAPAEVLDGRRVVRTITLRAASRGKVAFRLTGLEPGAHRITVRYLGSPSVKAASRTWPVSLPR